MRNSKGILKELEDEGLNNGEGKEQRDSLYTSYMLELGHRNSLKRYLKARAALRAAKKPVTQAEIDYIYKNELEGRRDPGFSSELLEEALVRLVMNGLAKRENGRFEYIEDNGGEDRL